MEWLFWILLALALSLGAFTAVRVARDIRAMAKSRRHPRIYLAGPYTSDPDGNTKIAMREGAKLLQAGYMVFVPHLSHYWHLECPQHYEVWMQYDLAWLETCVFLIRLPGYSPGADREVEFARKHGIPVYDSVADFLEEQGECQAKGV